jgi:hypothetical protein
MKVRTCTCTRVLPDGNRISIGYITLYEGIFRTSVWYSVLNTCVAAYFVEEVRVQLRVQIVGHCSYLTLRVVVRVRVQYTWYTVHVIHSTRVRVGLHVHHIVHVPELYNVYSCTHTRSPTCTCTVQLYTYGAFNASILQIKRIKTHAFNKIVYVVQYVVSVRVHVLYV